MKKAVFAAWFLVTLLTASFVGAHQGATGIVKERMDAFKRSQTQLKAAAKAAKSGEFETVERLAQSLSEWGRIMPSTFPEGSLYPPSEASPDIWTDFARFTALAQDFSASADRLAVAATAQDGQSVMNAIGAVGHSCKSCHKLFREK